MKTTVKLAKHQSISVSPCIFGVRIEIKTCNADGAASVDAYNLTPDQCGALLFGIEQAAEVCRIKAERRAGATA